MQINKIVLQFRTGVATALSLANDNVLELVLALSLAGKAADGAATSRAARCG